MSSPASFEVCIRNQGSALVRSIGEPAPYSVLDGVPIGSAVVSMTPKEWFELGLEFSGHIPFLQAQGYSAAEIQDLASKKLR